MFATLLVNAVLVGSWSVFVCILCKKINVKHFGENNKRYRPKKWENNGRWYVKRLKINKWKDLIPQYVSKDGFSKAHFGRKDLDVEYVNQFILETCRAEWVHSLFALVAVPIVMFNDPQLGLPLGALVVAFSLLVISIQRYNRIRLQRMRRKMLKDRSKAVSVGHSEVLLCNE